MITTNKINVILSKGKLKSRQVTTKNLNVGIRVEPPKGSIKPRGVSTTTLPDVSDIIEKKRRDGIMAKLEKAKKAEKAKAKKAEKAKAKKSAIKDEKGVVMIEQKKTGKKLVVTFEDGPCEEGHMKVKKPWNKMNGAERKEYQREKAEEKEEVKE